MATPPSVKPGDCVFVGEVEGIVQSVYVSGTSAHAFTFLYMDRSNHPTTHPIDWDGENWVFSDSGHYGRTARDSEPYVWELKKKHKL